MDNDKQRIAIAEACPAVVEWHDGNPYWKGGWSAAGEGNEHFAAFEPLTDLNAMHEAEKALEKQYRGTYARHLREILHPEDYLNREFAHWVGAHATAANQRAARLEESLERVISAWKFYVNSPKAPIMATAQMDAAVVDGIEQALADGAGGGRE